MEARKKAKEEREIRLREAKLLAAAEKGAEAADSSETWAEDDYERELMASPNDSKLWIRYMAFRLSLADVEGARAVATRALKTILFREEDEKMNVWVALLNLEHKFGTKVSHHAKVNV